MRGRQGKKLDLINSWFGRNRLSAVDRRSKLDSTTYIYNYDRGSWHYRTYLSYQEFTHRIALIFASAGAFGTGIAQLIYQFFGS